MSLLAALAEKFPSPGVGTADDAGHGCGATLGVDKGFGSRELGFAVFLPRANLGGDNCVGLPKADLALVVPVR